MQRKLADRRGGSQSVSAPDISCCEQDNTGRKVSDWTGEPDVDHLMCNDDDFSGAQNGPKGGSHQHQSAAEGVKGDEDSLMSDEEDS